MKCIYLFSAVCSAMAIAGCSPENLPNHRYVETDGETYLYERRNKISEMDRLYQIKRGIPIALINFRYLGKNRSGQHMIGVIDRDGKIYSKLYCSDPCKTIQRDKNDQAAIIQDPVVMDAFQDAIDGNLQIAKNGLKIRSKTRTRAETEAILVSIEKTCELPEYTFQFDGSDAVVATYGPGMTKGSLKCLMAEGKRLKLAKTLSLYESETPNGSRDRP